MQTSCIWPFLKTDPVPLQHASGLRSVLPPEHHHKEVAIVGTFRSVVACDSCAGTVFRILMGMLVCLFLATPTAAQVVGMIVDNWTDTVIVFERAHDLTDAFDYNEHLEDMNLDGHMDLMTHYRVQETGIARGDAEATLSGQLLDGQWIGEPTPSRRFAVHPSGLVPSYVGSACGPRIGSHLARSAEEGGVSKFSMRRVRSSRGPGTSS